ncbi:MAG: zinc metallopeptidase [Desulfobacterales bacterium]|jgi:Zn-dependent membrane protease YugP
MIYIILPLILTLFGPHLWAKHVLNKHNRQEYFSGTGIDLARMLLTRLKIKDVTVDVTNIGDHYDPVAKSIRLTEKRCGRKTLTAVVVAAHEVGHAIQDHTGYKPLITRTRMIGTARKIERFGAVLMMGVPVLAALTRVPSVGVLMFLAGFATLCIPVLVHLLTLPTEFDASFKRALPMLASGAYIPPEDIPAAKKILLACALTYVSNSLIGLLNVWRWIRLLRR